MNTDRKRLAVIAGSTLALVLSGASIVSAQTATTTQTPQQVQLNGGDMGGGRGFGPGGPGQGGFGRGGDMGGGRGFAGDFGGPIRGDVTDLVSQTVVRLDADGNVLTDKVEHGTVAQAQAHIAQQPHINAVAAGVGRMHVLLAHRI